MKAFFVNYDVFIRFIGVNSELVRKNAIMLNFLSVKMIFVLIVVIVNNFQIKNSKETNKNRGKKFAYSIKTREFGVADRLE